VSKRSWGLNPKFGLCVGPHKQCSRCKVDVVVSAVCTDDGDWLLTYCIV